MSKSFGRTGDTRNNNPRYMSRTTLVADALAFEDMADDGLDVDLDLGPTEGYDTYTSESQGFTVQTIVAGPPTEVRPRLTRPMPRTLPGDLTPMQQPSKVRIRPEMVRLSTLAGEMGVDVQVILDMLRDLGEYVKDGRSAVPSIVANDIRTLLS